MCDLYLQPSPFWSTLAISIYKPSCNPDQYDRTWKDTWIGAYQTPMTGPLTTGHAPDSARSETTGDQSAGR